MTTDPFCHSASIEVDVTAQQAFDFMSDGMKQGKWALGSWDRSRRQDGIFEGTSLFSGEKTYVRIETDPDNLMVYYDVGGMPDSDQMARRIIARIVPGPVVGMGEDNCVVSLIAWRVEGMTILRWHQLCTSHETEVLMIKHQIESGA